MHQFRSIPIKYRLILTYLLVSTIPLALIGCLAVGTYANATMEKIEHSTIETLSVLRRATEAEIENYQYVGGVISINDTVQESLRQHMQEPEIPAFRFGPQIGQALTEIAPSLYLPYVVNIRIADKNGDILYDLGYDNISQEQHHAILTDCDSRAPMDSWAYVNTFRKSDTLVIARRFQDAQKLDTTIGYVMVFVRESLFSGNLLADVDLGDGSALTILKNDGTVLSTTAEGIPLGVPYSDSKFSEKIHLRQDRNDIFSFEYDFEGGRGLVCCAPLRNMDSFLVASIPFSYIYSEIESVSLVIFFTVLTLICICLLLSLFLYRSIVGPITNIEQFCEEFASGSLSARIEDASGDEMGVLSRNVNSMADRILLLMNQQKEEQKRKRKLELQMLQYQINPHFLFNTLNTLKWIAVINKVPVVSNGITALAELLKSTIVNKQEFIPLREEIENLKNYFEIQKLRYANCFTVAYELDEQLLETLVPKFILQPLTENSILHGIDTASITITIRCYRQDDVMILEAEDNGIGFDSEAFDALAHKKMTGIGVSNVDERLKLSFGPQYGLQMYSQVGKGTLCRMHIPLNFKEGSNRHENTSG